MGTQEYTRQLEETLRKFLHPVKDIPYSLVIKVISGYEVLPFDKNHQADQALLARLTEAMHNATCKAYKQGIRSTRRNEVGNYIEAFVKSALGNLGMSANVPSNSQGKRQSAGYPDILLEDIDGRMSYLECKTYQKKSKGSNFRSFYLQASNNCKITCAARHLMATFEIVEEIRDGENFFVPTGWEIYTLEDLYMQVKHEINANNRAIYQASALLAKGELRTNG